MALLELEVTVREEYTPPIVYSLDGVYDRDNEVSVIADAYCKSGLRILIVEEQITPVFHNNALFVSKNILKKDGK